jgi:alkanesulfonate monooxygenase SsuD/methylene tetrahydromethanopterin reductase-like flavin-dependent oxidoreductase (luciferase family)
MHTAAHAVHQTVELPVAAEQIGIDGAFVRVHHFARQLASPFPLLTAIGVRTSRIEIGTGVIDMRYENPLYVAETAAAADLLAGGRLQLGLSRGSPEAAWRGPEAFGCWVDPITSDLDRRLFGADANEDQVGWLDGALSRFGRSYTGEPDRLAEELAEDAAVEAADTILLTVPSQLGVDYNARMLETIAREIAPAVGWSARLPEPVGSGTGKTGSPR